MTFHVVSVGKVAAGDSKSVSVSYRKDDNRLAAEILGLPTPQNVPFEGESAAPARAGISTPTIIIAGAAVLAILAVVGAWLWARSRQAPVDNNPGTAKPALLHVEERS